MGACALVSILASLLLCAEAASSDPFSSSHVATLGSDYAEKVRAFFQASLRCAHAAPRLSTTCKLRSTDVGQRWQAILCQVLCTLVW